MIDWLMKAHPRRWRSRYEDEFRALLDHTDMSPRTVVNVAAHAVRMHLRYRQRLFVSLASLLSFFVWEVIAIRVGVADNIFWVPRDVTSLVLLTGVVGSLLMALRPVIRYAVGKVRA